MRSLRKYAKALIALTMVLAMFLIGSVNVFADTVEWQNVGSASFSAGTAGYTSIAERSSICSIYGLYELS